MTSKNFLLKDLQMLYFKKWHNYLLAHSLNYEENLLTY